ncbi:MAG: NADH:ubiquinone reductase (Na(+)-transporting) subunit F [Bacteroidetes bacterium]|jgi:Na+-transporting NADH:ubiquinone oxidoreductase subunit F|nr:NADH:ubiquinone reductase (Na(+)-transporting) subunit F [Bacteroidota bacterium]
MALAIPSAAAIAVVILGLVTILFLAQKKLLPQGEVTININGEKNLSVKPGASLLNVLGSNSVFLPSACGGGGTCAMCKCQVIDGGGDVLPTEKGHLTRSEQQNHWRLACQVKVRGDLKIKVPEEIFGIKKWECEVISNGNVATFIKEFKVKLPEGEHLEFEAGGYIQIDVPEGTYKFADMKVEDRFRDDWDKFKMWDLVTKVEEPIFRAYSMANHPAEGNIVMLNIRIATPPWDRNAGKFMDVNPGLCSSYIFTRKPGDKVTVSGPYGEFFIKPTNREMVYIGGGAGMAPLRAHIFHLFHTLKTDRKVSYWYGGRSKRELFYTEHFREIESKFPNFQYNIALSEPMPEDNWTGYVGFIHKVVLDNYLSKHEEPEEIEFYLCGPPMMNDAVFKMLDSLGVPDENIAFDDFGG